MGIKINKALIISGAPKVDIEQLKLIYSEEYFVICADAGYNHAKNALIKPNLLVGDYDTISVPNVDIETIVLPSEKDETDTFFAVKTAINRGYNEIIIFGAIGSRIDHSYANLLCLDYICKNNCKGKIITSNCSVELLLTGNHTINKENYKYFSIFPFLTDVSGLSEIKVKYPLSNVELGISSQLGVSNEMIESSCNISFSNGKLLLIKSND